MIWRRRKIKKIKPSSLGNSRIEFGDVLKGAASAFVDSSVTSSVVSSTSNATTQSYLHPKASQEVAFARHVLNPYLGLIKHATRRKSFRICLKPNLMLPDRRPLDVSCLSLSDQSSRFLKLSDSPSFNSKSSFLESIISSWGAFTQWSGGNWRRGVDTNRECSRSVSSMVQWKFGTELHRLHAR